ncbi:hypothetical protein REJC140_02492 [Pseudorhizobium endolithicum]|uniref:Uncharacterized protein n=1 Tax=Pseudorhizobium endolithicum TaxID=1191678 RepID=A0ABM8PFR7_9HYPH|nr:hypothetical protein [Pseudorhizobium endolithicum]CAD7027361.1 hypothetical protein REJC140_02492 [Pseudorhizobium endolithicum]
MWAWLSENYGVVSAVASVATLLVWVLYLQLFYMSHRHQLRPKILITRGGGHKLSARCILTNMSPEIVFIQGLLVRIAFDDRELFCSLSDIERVASQGSDPRSELFQGPVSVGEYLDLGSFEEIALAAMENCTGTRGIGDLRELGLTAVGIYPWKDGMVAAERSFTVRHEDGRRALVSDKPTARQIRSRRELRRVERIMWEQAQN